MQLFINLFLYKLTATEKEGVIVALEPWRCFRVTNEGIGKGKGKLSIVSLDLIEEELIYEKEIPPEFPGTL